MDLHHYQVVYRPHEVCFFIQNYQTHSNSISPRSCISYNSPYKFNIHIGAARDESLPQRHELATPSKLPSSPGSQPSNTMNILQHIHDKGIATNFFNAPTRTITTKLIHKSRSLPDMQSSDLTSSLPKQAAASSVNNGISHQTTQILADETFTMQTESDINKSNDNPSSQRTITPTRPSRSQRAGRVTYLSPLALDQDEVIPPIPSPSSASPQSQPIMSPRHNAKVNVNQQAIITELTKLIHPLIQNSTLTNIPIPELEKLLQSMTVHVAAAKSPQPIPANCKSPSYSQISPRRGVSEESSQQTITKNPLARIGSTDTFATPSRSRSLSGTHPLHRTGSIRARSNPSIIRQSNKMQRPLIRSFNTMRTSKTIPQLIQQELLSPIIEPFPDEASYEWSPTSKGSQKTLRSRSTRQYPNDRVSVGLNSISMNKILVHYHH